LDEQLLAKALLNAILYSPSGASILVEAGDREFTIENTGHPSRRNPSELSRPSTAWNSREDANPAAAVWGCISSKPFSTGTGQPAKLKGPRRACGVLHNSQKVPLRKNPENVP
jgi:hypothetical protein